MISQRWRWGLLAVLVVALPAFAWQAKPRAIYLSLVLQETTVTVNASWTHPQADDMSFPWYVQGDSLAANGTTLQSSVSYQRDRQSTDVTESFCVLARRLRDGKESNPVCSPYTIPALEVEEPPPPPPDSLDVGVEAPPPAVPNVPVAESLPDGSTRWTWDAVSEADDYPWSAGGGRSGVSTTPEAILDPNFANEPDPFFCVKARNTAGESTQRCNTLVPPSAMILDSLTTFPESFTIFLPDSLGNPPVDSLGNELPQTQLVKAIGWKDGQSLWCDGLWYTAVQDAEGEWQQGGEVAYAEPCEISWCSSDPSVASVSVDGVDQGACETASIECEELNERLADLGHTFLTEWSVVLGGTCASESVYAWAGG